ncbi:MAG: MFS transporter [Woeseiaceae bacterium]
MPGSGNTRRQAGVVQGVILSLVTFLPIMATLSVAPAIPRLIEHFDAIPNAAVLVTMLLSVPAIFIAITSPFVGIPIKRFGRKPILVWGVALYGVFGLAPFFLEDLYAILITRAGVGVAEAMLVTVGKALIGDYYSGERRQRWVGYQTAIDATLGTLMWFIGGLLATFGWRSPFLLYLVAIPLLVAVIFLIWEPEPSDEDKAATAAASQFPWRRMAVVYAITMFTAAMYFSYPTQIARALTELGVTTPFTIGLLTAIASIGTPLGAIYFSRATQVSIPVMLGIGLAFIGLPYVGIGLSAHPYVATGIGFIQQIGNGIVGAGLVMWCLRCLPFEHRGQGMGIWGTFLVSGIFVSPLLFALLERTTGTVQNGFIIMGSVCAVSALVIPVIIRRTMPPEVIAAQSRGGKD